MKIKCWVTIKTVFFPVSWAPKFFMKICRRWTTVLIHIEYNILLKIKEMTLKWMWNFVRKSVTSAHCSSWVLHIMSKMKSVLEKDSNKYCLFLKLIFKFLNFNLCNKNLLQWIERWTLSSPQCLVRTWNTITTRPHHKEN